MQCQKNKRELNLKNRNMKAINFKNEYYEITQQRGDFYYAKNSRGKVKVFATKDVEVIEIDQMPKTKVYKTKKSEPVKVDPILTWKDIALSINDKWNQNSTWKLAEQTIYNINAFDNEFIKSILMQAIKNDRISEKQAYCLAKYGVETGQLK